MKIQIPSRKAHSGNRNDYRLTIVTQKDVRIKGVR
jgi:hypothetical protein